MDYDTWADITEFASYQIKDFYTYLPIKYPNVRAAFVFGADRERMKFSLSNNYSYLEAYKGGTSSPLYSGNYEEDKEKTLYDYYELGNNVKVKAESSELCAFVSTPENDVAKVSYYIDGSLAGSSSEAPFSVPVDFSAYAGSTVEVCVRSYNSNGDLVTEYTVRIKVQ